MKQHIKIICRHCGNDDPAKNGHSENGTQRYRCNNCKKSFQINYCYNAWQPGVKDQIETQPLNSSGVRDIGRNLKISKNTVISELKKNSCRNKSVLCKVREQFVSVRTGCRNPDGCGCRRVLELCREQRQTAMDLVCG